MQDTQGTLLQYVPREEQGEGGGGERGREEREKHQQGESTKEMRSDATTRWHIYFPDAKAFERASAKIDGGAYKAARDILTGAVRTPLTHETAERIKQLVAELVSPLLRRHPSMRGH